MKIKPILCEEMKKLFVLDDTIPEGLRWIVDVLPNKCKGNPAGTLQSSGYYGTAINRSVYKNHRIIYSIYNNVDLTDEIIDHIDICRTNNNPINLRKCSLTENLRNKTKYKGGTSKYRGVSFGIKENKWRAQIQVNKVGIHLGLFSSEIDAAKAYNHYIATHNLEYFNLNKIEEN